MAYHDESVVQGDFCATGRMYSSSLRAWLHGTPRSFLFPLVARALGYYPEQALLQLIKTLNPQGLNNWVGPWDI